MKVEVAHVPDAADKPAPATTMIFLDPRRAFSNLAIDSLMALLVQKYTRRGETVDCDESQRKV